MKTKIILNSDNDLVKEIKNSLKNNKGFCPCKIKKDENDVSTKCICQEFRNMIDENKIGECHCGLYVLVEEN